jgi:hypothetical protein
MIVHHEKIWAVAAFALLSTGACSTDSAQQTDDLPDGFTPLFDGTTLNGWRGDETIWSVRDGAITGGSDEVIPHNTFLIYQHPYEDFELRYTYRMSGKGNSGVQFRSIVSDEAQFGVHGYQANVVPTDQAERFGMLYEEGGRNELALLGHRMVIDNKDGQIDKNVMESTNPRDKLLAIARPYPEWNDVVVIAYGNRILHALNDHLVFDAVDNDPAGRTKGVFGLQVHSGPPSYVQFKSFDVKPLTAAPDLDNRFITNPGPPTPANPGPRVPRT